MPYDIASARKAIIIECRKQGLDDDTRHELIRAVGQVASGSTRDMGADAARRVLNHLRGKSASAGRPAHEWTFIDTAIPARRPLLKKLLMLAREIGIEKGKQVAYIEGIARQMSGTAASAGPVAKPLPMCDEHELWRIVQALAVFVKRNERRAG